MRANGVKLPAPNTSGNGPIFNTKGMNTASASSKPPRASARATCTRPSAGAQERGGTGAAPAPRAQPAGAAPPAERAAESQTRGPTRRATGASGRVRGPGPTGASVEDRRPVAELRALRVGDRRRARLARDLRRGQRGDAVISWFHWAALSAPAVTSGEGAVGPSAPSARRCAAAAALSLGVAGGGRNSRSMRFAVSARGKRVGWPG